HRRPVRIFAPAIAATFKRSGVFQAESVFIFKVVGEERRLIAPAKLVGSGFAEINFSQMTRGVAPLSVVPWTDNQKVFMRRIMKTFWLSVHGTTDSEIGRAHV